MDGKPDIPVKFVKNVGPGRESTFNEIGIRTVRDLLFYFPRKHLDRTNILASAQAKKYVANGYEGELTVVAEVAGSELVRYGRKQIFKVMFKDSSGLFECVWFQGIKFFKNRFADCDIYAVSGKPTVSRYGNLQFVHPDFDRLESEESQQFRNTGKIIPFYSLPEKLKKKHIGILNLRSIIRNAVNKYAHEIPESLPEYLLTKNKLPGLVKTVKDMHFPEKKESLELAIRRMKYEELFFFELLVAKKRRNYREGVKGISFNFSVKRIKAFLQSLPFELTPAQLKVLSEIRADMETPVPMNRLLQGDVGSGKTIVAVIMMLAAIDNGYQAVMMAPTEILASQHYIKIENLLKNFGVKVSLITGSQKKKERRAALEEAASSADIIIGTHALFEEQVEFRNAGLYIIDEQHRFGVAQRAGLIGKSFAPDTLVMTATPIPRTLTMTLYGDLDVSIIDSLPEGRKPIKTTLHGERKLPEIYESLAKKAAEGSRIYIVYPLVEESEKLDLKDAESYYEALSSSYFKDLRVGLLHGKMKWNEKEAVMQAFASGELDVLVSTTVIEVGVDVPEANIMVINDAHRFGLSQLHQLRGRVGRGRDQSYCLLVTKEEILAQRIPASLDYISGARLERSKAIIRLRSMAQHTSGFKLSEIDLKLRGPGDIFGTKQSGLPELKFAELGKDQDILVSAKEDAFELIQTDPGLSQPEHQSIKEKLYSEYAENLKFAGIA